MYKSQNYSNLLKEKVITFILLLLLFPVIASATNYETNNNFEFIFLAHEAELDKDSIRNILNSEVSNFFMQNDLQVDKKIVVPIVTKLPEPGWNSIFIVNHRTSKEEYIGTIFESAEGYKVVSKGEKKYFRMAQPSFYALVKNALNPEDLGSLFLPTELNHGFFHKEYTPGLESKLSEVLTVFFEDMDLHNKLTHFDGNWSNSYLKDTPLFLNDMAIEDYNINNIINLDQINFFEVIKQDYLFSRVSAALIKMPYGYRSFFSNNPLKSINFSVDFCANYEKESGIVSHLGGAYNRETTDLYLCMHETDYSDLPPELAFSAGYTILPGQTLMHEMGHHLFNRMTDQKREEFTELGWDKKFFGGYKHKKDYKYVSGYAKTSPSEDFSESFAEMILRKRRLKISHPKTLIFMENLSTCLINNKDQTKCGLKATP